MTNHALEILRLNDVIAITKLSRSSIYARIQQGEFPKQFTLGQNARSVGWLRSDVDSWIGEQSKTRITALT